MRTKKISSLRTRERAEKGGTCKQKATRRDAIGQRKGARMQGNTHIWFLRAWIQVALGHPLSRHYKANNVAFCSMSFFCVLLGKGR